MSITAPARTFISDLSIDTKLANQQAALLEKYRSGNGWLREVARKTLKDSSPEVLLQSLTKNLRRILTQSSYFRAHPLVKGKPLNAATADKFSIHNYDGQKSVQTTHFGEVDIHIDSEDKQNCFYVSYEGTPLFSFAYDIQGQGTDREIFIKQIQKTRLPEAQTPQQKKAKRHLGRYHNKIDYPLLCIALAEGIARDNGIGKIRIQSAENNHWYNKPALSDRTVDPRAAQKRIRVALEQIYDGSAARIGIKEPDIDGNWVYQINTASPIVLDSIGETETPAQYTPTTSILHRISHDLPMLNIDLDAKIAG